MYQVIADGDNQELVTKKTVIRTQFVSKEANNKCLYAPQREFVLNKYGKKLVDRIILKGIEANEYVDEAVEADN